jgi:hypothetical protein
MIPNRGRSGSGGWPTGWPPASRAESIVDRAPHGTAAGSAKPTKIGYARYYAYIPALWLWYDVTQQRQGMDHRMDLLTKPISTFSFSDVVSFCENDHQREGYQLDYKQEMPKNGIAKLLAAFSNTRGGVIVIGVAEDQDTGLPMAWHGVANPGKIVEQICQYATNVDPIPRFEYHVTNPGNNGNVFILVRVLEGDRTPYYVHNDPNIWVRTGNVGNPVDRASPGAAELLYRKLEKASLAQQLAMGRANRVYDAAIRRSQRIFLQQPTSDQLTSESGNDAKPERRALALEAVIFRVIVLPYYPGQPIDTPRSIQRRLREINTGDGRFRIDFPSLIMEPIPDGLLYIDGGTGPESLRCEQIYSNGLTYLLADIAKFPGSGRKYVEIVDMIVETFHLLKATANFYRLFGYQGAVTGEISLQHCEGVLIQKSSGDVTVALLDTYHLSFEWDTSVLLDDATFQEHFFGLVREWGWHLGFDWIDNRLLGSIMRAKEWLAPDT